MPLPFSPPPPSPRDPLFSPSYGTPKRSAADAGLDSGDVSASRRELSKSQSRSTILERQIFALQATERDQAKQIEEQRLEIERLKSDRRLLAASERREKEALEECEQQWNEEKSKLQREVSSLRTRNSELDGETAELRQKYSRLSRTHNSLVESAEGELDLLRSRIVEVEGERDRLKGWERRAGALAIELEEERRRAQEGRSDRDEEVDDQKVDRVMKDELHRQAAYLQNMERASGALKAEVAELRHRRDNVEQAQRAAREAERSLRDEIRVLRDELDRARRDMDSLTHTFPSPSDSDPQVDVATLQSRLSALSTSHAALSALVTSRDAELLTLTNRHEKLLQDSTSQVLSLTRRAQDAERELRWANEGRKSAERREQMAKKEVAAVRASERSSGSAESKSSSPARVQELEALVETYRAEFESIARDSRGLEDQLATGAGMVKQSVMKAAEAKVAALEQQIQELEGTIDALTQANTSLDAEVTAMMQRVASGEFNPTRERCIELKGNPASKAFAIRQKALDDLKAENQALLARVGGDETVPRETYERLVKEGEEREAAHSKRLQRLKETFGSKSKEFLEAVYSLLGWRIRFDESGADIRLTSMYAPKGKMGLTLKFTSEEGHFGTMQMIGGMARGLEQARDFWIAERQSVPGFLAQVTSEMFEKTTMGRAAGYVGLG